MAAGKLPFRCRNGQAILGRRELPQASDARTSSAAKTPVRVAVPSDR
jgi:hypothetical protein